MTRTCQVFSTHSKTVTIEPSAVKTKLYKRSPISMILFTVMTNYTLTRVLTSCPGGWHERMWRAMRKREGLKDCGCMKRFSFDHERDITNRAGMKQLPPLSAEAV